MEECPIRLAIKEINGGRDDLSETQISLNTDEFIFIKSIRKIERARVSLMSKRDIIKYLNNFESGTKFIISNMNNIKILKILQQELKLLENNIKKYKEYNILVLNKDLINFDIEKLIEPIYYENNVVIKNNLDNLNTLNNTNLLSIVDSLIKEESDLMDKMVDFSKKIKNRINEINDILLYFK